MAEIKKTLYNVAINGVGYILSGIPLKPARRMSQTPVLGVYPTQVDLEHKDSSSLLPWVQTDWSGGFQEKKWVDSATFKNGSGLEYIKEYGQLTLLNDKSAVQTVGADYTFGASCIYNRLLMIGTKHATLAMLGHLNSSDVWTALTTGWTNISEVNSMDELQGKVYLALKRTTGVEKCLQSWDGTSFVDATGDAVDSSEWRMVKRIRTRLYASNLNSAPNGDRLLYSDNEGANWTEIITKTGKNREITQGVNNMGILYFLIEDFPATELWMCNDTILAQIYRWENLTNPYLSQWLGKIYVFGKEDTKIRLFEYDGAVLRTRFEERISGLDVDTGPMIVYKNNLYSYGIVFDGKFCFPSWVFKYVSKKIYPFAVFGGTDSQVPYFYGLDGTSLTITKLNTSAYLTTGNVFSGIYTAGKTAVDKLWHSVIIGFKKLLSGQSIKIEYSVDDEVTWTEVGAATYANTGNGADTEKTLYFAADTTSKRIQIRITLAGAGTDTPTLYDIALRFLPLSDNRFRWNLVLDCRNNLMLLDGKTKEAKKGEELRSLLHIAKFQNQIVDYHDIDYGETAINDVTGITQTDTTITVDSTAGFPEQSRIKIGQEEILYTGKTAVAFTGCVRGARGTKSTTHADNAAVSNVYRVLVTNVAEVNPVAAEAKIKEAAVAIELMEV